MYIQFQKSIVDEYLQKIIYICSSAEKHMNIWIFGFALNWHQYSLFFIGNANEQPKPDEDQKGRRRDVPIAWDHFKKKTAKNAWNMQLLW